jgi:hypothetical protein
LEFRKRAIDSYPVLFGEQDDQEEQNDFSETTQFGKQWGWYQSIYQLAKGDITKFERVTETGLFECLTMLTFEKQKSEIETRQIKRAHERIL